MNFLDQAILFFSPSTAMRREQSRRAIEIMSKRRYEGAAAGRRTDNWQARGTSANAEISLELAKLRDRSRDMVRNNGYAKRAVNVIKNNVVGAGIRPAITNAKSKTKNEKAKRAWKQWAETTDCDYGGQMTFYGIQKMAMSAVAESGECLILKRRVKNTRSGIPIRLQIIEADYLDTSKTYMLDSGGFIMSGVEYGADGQRAAYWMYDRHPGEQIGMGTASKRVNAEDVLHIYEILRPGQVRGVPMGVAAFLRLKDFDDYEDAQLMRQKIAACYSVFITGDPGELSTVQREEAERIEPGIIEYLPPGKQVSFSSPPPAEGFGEYSRKVLQGIAAAYGITYEALTNDLSNVNFSSGRMGWIEMSRNIDDWQQNIVIPMLCNPVFNWFLDAAAIAGRGGSSVDVSWTTPRREMINPAQEVPAIINAIRGGLMSQSEALRQAGKDPQEVMDEMKADNDMMDKLGLILDSDPRKTMKAGVTQAFLDTAAGAAGFEDGTEKT